MDLDGHGWGAVGTRTLHPSKSTEKTIVSRGHQKPARRLHTLGVGCLVICVGRDLALFEGQDYFDETAQTTGSL